MSQKVLVIGGVALGPKVAARYSRLVDNADITLIDQDQYISYGGCGIPYYLSGDVSNLDDLRMTVAHEIRNEHFFDTVKSVKARTGVKALKINRAEKNVLVEVLETGEKETLSYDKLVISTGARPRQLTVEGADLKNVTAVTNLHEAKDVHEACASGKIQTAVVVGAGFIGLEVAVALADMWGIEVSVIEVFDQILPTVSNEHSARIAEDDLKKLGVNVVLNEKVVKLEGENGYVKRVITDKQVIDADLVIASIGFIPNTDLAKEAGLDCIANGAIKVDKYMRTSDPDIYSGGDCCSVKNIINGQDGYIPLGSMANRQGRIIGSNLAYLANNQERADSFDGYVGSWCVKLNELSFAGVGFTQVFAEKNGFDAVTVAIEGDDHAHFYPDATMTTMQIVVDKKTRKILGFQACSTNTDAVKARVDAVAVLMQFGNATIDNLSNAEIVYAPPFASAMDIINSVANVADNVLAGRLEAMEPTEFLTYWNEKDSNGIYVVDIRPPHQNVLDLQKKYPNSFLSLPLEQLKERMNEVPKDKKIILSCSTGTRSYEALILLKRAGYNNIIASVYGGAQSLRKRGDSLE